MPNDLKFCSLPEPDLAVHMPVEEWMEGVKSGLFTDDDGIGFWATPVQESNCPVLPSCHTPQPPWATHVVWYNK